jgi:pimeloyl-ACP methyl ester carboxylesterase
MGYSGVNDTKIYYEICGKGEYVAFLNGIFMSTQSFSQFLPLFSKKYSVLLHDFRGQWNSGKEGEKYSLELHSKDFYKLLNELKIEKINIVGVSYGGEKFSKIIKKNIENSELVIIGDSGHAIPVEKRNELETVIYGFLEKIKMNERS